MHAGYLWPFQMIADDDLQRNFNDLVVEGVSLSNWAKFSNFGAEKKPKFERASKGTCLRDNWKCE